MIYVLQLSVCSDYAKRMGQILNRIAKTRIANQLLVIKLNGRVLRGMYEVCILVGTRKEHT